MVCVFVCMYATSMPCLQKPEKALDPLFLELLTTVSSPLWVLGIKPSASGKAASSYRSRLSSPGNCI